MCQILKRKFALMLICCSLLGLFLPSVVWADDQTAQQPLASDGTLAEVPYLRQFEMWQKHVQDAADFSQLISVTGTHDKQDVVAERQNIYSLNDGQSLVLTVTVPKTALYQLSFDYFIASNAIQDHAFSLQVNGVYPFNEARRLIVHANWENVTDDVVINASGRQLIPQQQMVQGWHKTTLQTAEALVADGFRLLLEAGVNTIELTGVSGEWSIDQIEVHAPTQVMPYKAYQTDDLLDHSGLITVEAEHSLSRNRSSIRPFHAQSTSVEPYSGEEVLLNAFGGGSWAESGQRATWSFYVPEAGTYHLTVKMNQLDKRNAPVFRKILLDDAVPFAELLAYRIDPTSDWENHTLGNEEEAFSFFLTEGQHTLTMEATAAPLAEAIYQLDELMEAMRALGLDVKKLTGNQTDANRDWTVADYLPEIDTHFAHWEKALSTLSDSVQEIYGEKGSNAQELVQLALVEKKIAQLGQNVNDLPNRLADLSEGSNSVVQTLALIQTQLQEQPLSLDRFYVHGSSAKLPQAKVGFTTDAARKLKAFLGSFSRQSVQEEADSIDVWVARSQQYVELMQQMAESTFTHETGIKVNFSVMPNEQKLILANASGQQPDIALGISVGTPYELAIRGSAQDLTAFADFKEIAGSFSPGAFLPMTIDEGIYALPETQDFYVQFARTDILNHLALEVPDLWTDVTGILPELQRVGMNYFVPLSGSAGTKPFMFTAPFIYQFGGALYSEDGTSTAIDQEQSLAGLQFMSDLYALYSLPQQVPNFYHSFRYGTLPVGISNFETYVKLTAAAPEIANTWDISLYPGVLEADGTVNRWATGSAQSAMMFDQSTQKESAWTFMKWWLSAETQTNFAQNLQTVYGPEYMWNTANLEAFAQLPWPEAHKEVILAQWAFLKEVPKTPGAYILEREISNVWTDVVFNGIHLKASVDDRVITINREIRRKLAEFGYMEGNRVLRPYHIPTLEGMEAWLHEE